MSFAARASFAVVVLTVDTLTVLVPLCAVIFAIVLLTRPPWFKRLVDAIYADLTPPAGPAPGEAP